MSDAIEDSRRTRKTVHLRANLAENQQSASPKEGTKLLTGVGWLESENAKVTKWITSFLRFLMRKSVMARKVFDNLREDARLMGIIELLESGEELLSEEEARRRCVNAVGRFMSKECRREARRMAMENNDNGEVIKLTTVAPAMQEIIADANKLARIGLRLSSRSTIEDMIDEPVSVTGSILAGKIRRELRLK